MSEASIIADACEVSAVTMLNYALRTGGLRTRLDIEQDRLAIIEAHRLLECAAMLRAAKATNLGTATEFAQGDLSV